MAKTEHFEYCGSTLTLHEMRIIALHCIGLRRKDIAQRMGHSPWTLNNQVKKIFLKVGRESAVGLVAQAMANGFDGLGRYRERDLINCGPTDDQRPD
jgi:DNA-binding CsgD family transcriptional regulator